MKPEGRIRSNHRAAAAVDRIIIIIIILYGCRLRKFRRLFKLKINQTNAVRLAMLEN